MTEYDDEANLVWTYTGVRQASCRGIDACYFKLTLLPVMWLGGDIKLDI